MRGFGRLLYSEIKRLRHTSLLYLHIAVPAAGTAAFLWYYSLAGWESRSEVLVYFQTVALCVALLLRHGMRAFRGDGGSFRISEFFPSARQKISCAACEMDRAAGAWAAGRSCCSHGIFSCLPLLSGWKCIWALDMSFQCCFDLPGAGDCVSDPSALSFAAGKGVSICFGIAGTLLSFLFLTGLGDGKWMFFPWTWGGRFFHLSATIYGGKGQGAEAFRDDLEGGRRLFGNSYLFNLTGVCVVL